MYEAIFSDFGWCLLKRWIYLPKFLVLHPMLIFFLPHTTFSHISSVTRYVSLYKETQQWYLTLTSILTDSTTHIPKIGFGEIAYISDISFQAHIDKKKETLTKKYCWVDLNNSHF